MRDSQTGSWWQQVSGEAIQGSFKGQKLSEVFHDEVTFGVWKREHPNGRVLRPDEKIFTADKYEKATWEDEVGKMPVRINAKIEETFRAANFDNRHKDQRNSKGLSILIVRKAKSNFR